MIHRIELLNEARRWLGTPYHDQASARGIGCDCAGLFVGIGREMDITIISNHTYPEMPSGPELQSYLEENCTRLVGISHAEHAPVGSILAYRIRNDPGPHHLALRTDTGMLHAWGKGCVVEHPLWNEGRLHSVWWHPEVS